MKILSNAKINLGLRVLSKRTDGYHDLETVMVPIALFDEITLEESAEFSFQQIGYEIHGEQAENICVKAYQLLKSDFSLPAVKILLDKNIPIGAGLGGGSSNAAFVIKALNELFKLGLSIEKMENYARQLGSDCAFFIQNKIALAEGKGDVFVQDFNFEIPEVEVLLVNPNIHVSTATAYSGVKPDGGGTSLKELLKSPFTQWQGKVNNDFEKSIFKIYPKISRVKEKLVEKGAIYASMSGSGSTVYGLFEKNTASNLEWPSSYFIWKGSILNN